MPEHLRHDTRNYKVKLFPFSLIEKVKQWYTDAVESTNEDWDELKDKFYLAFFPMSHFDSLPRAILDFEQYEKESIRAALAKFLALIHAGLNLSLPQQRAVASLLFRSRHRSYPLP